MVQKGRLLVCDRCGNTEFIETENLYGCWLFVADKDLCPDCSELYNKMINNFFAHEVKRPINLEDQYEVESNAGRESLYAQESA